ncbi:MAG: ABC transporter ATP-binding protein, partial [Acidimicrobiia bacterium]|nr:ABC transporter ATP-binding protein [Acidimicrobiia bacterium]
MSTEAVLDTPATGEAPPIPVRAAELDDPILEARSLVKRYGDIEAVAGLDLSIQPGEVYCLLGPNGAGKT